MIDNLFVTSLTNMEQRFIGPNNISLKVPMQHALLPVKLLMLYYLQKSYIFLSVTALCVLSWSKTYLSTFEFDRYQNYSTTNLISENKIDNITKIEDE
jgi:hypothetical protein